MTVAAVVLATALWMTGKQGVYHDAENYHILAQLIGRAGLFGYSVSPDATGPYFPILLQVKPNGYPLFVALVGLFSTFEPERLHAVVFAVQLAIYLGVCWFAALRVGAIFDSPRMRLLVYAAGALNPLPLIHTTELLSDLLSAALIYLAVAFSFPAPHHRAPITRDVALSILAASLATIVRSANVAALGAVVLVWVLREWWFRDVNWRALPLFALLGVVPFVPQVVNNYLAFGSDSPFVARNEYATDLDFGARTFKYQTAVIAGDARNQWIYANPLLPPGVTTADEFIHTRPLQYAATLALHAFTLLDQDYPFPYVTEFHPWYRWPSALASYAYLAIAGIGLYFGLRAAARNLRSPTPVDFGFIAVSIVSAASFVFYLPPHVENRYSLPIYLLITLAFVAGARTLIRGLARATPKRIAGFAAVSFIFLASCAVLSNWFESLRRPLA